MKAAFYTLGCKVNQYETEYMAELLKNAGFEIVSNNEAADYFIINSCTVTATADQKTRQSVRRFKRNNPDSTVILTGCMPQAFPEDAVKLTEADIVLSNKDNENILKLINEYNLSKERVVAINKHKSGDSFSSCSINSFAGRIRAFVKIEDGCDRFCSYCIIPMARGRVRSKPLSELEKEVKTLSNQGIKEIVLVGINLSSYGKNEGFDLADAVKICNDNPNILRVRLGSLEPDQLTDSLIEKLSENNKLCPQFHISLQSGCDKTLRNMNRHYTSGEYKKLCVKLRSVFSDCTLTTDLMTGFHEETEEDFIESLRFVKEIAFEKVHTFPYSERVGTAASKRGDSVPKAEKERRANTVINEAAKIRTAFMKSQEGKKVSVLFESSKGNNYRGYTKNYIPVCINSENNILGKELEVTIKKYDELNDLCFASL